MRQHPLVKRRSFPVAGHDKRDDSTWAAPRSVANSSKGGTTPKNSSKTGSRSNTRQFVRGSSWNTSRITTGGWKERAREQETKPIPGARSAGGRLKGGAKINLEINEFREQGLARLQANERARRQVAVFLQAAFRGHRARTTDLALARYTREARQRWSLPEIFALHCKLHFEAEVEREREFNARVDERAEQMQLAAEYAGDQAFDAEAARGALVALREPFVFFEDAFTKGQLINFCRDYRLLSNATSLGVISELFDAHATPMKKRARRTKAKSHFLCRAKRGEELLPMGKLKELLAELGVTDFSQHDLAALRRTGNDVPLEQYMDYLKKRGWFERVEGGGVTATKATRTLRSSGGKEEAGKQTYVTQLMNSGDGGDAHESDAKRRRWEYGVGLQAFVGVMKQLATRMYPSQCLTVRPGISDHDQRALDRLIEDRLILVAVNIEHTGVCGSVGAFGQLTMDPIAVELATQYEPAFRNIFSQYMSDESAEAEAAEVEQPSTAIAHVRRQNGSQAVGDHPHGVGEGFPNTLKGGMDYINFLRCMCDYGLCPRLILNDSATGYKLLATFLGARQGHRGNAFFCPCEDVNAITRSCKMCSQPQFRLGPWENRRHVNAFALCDKDMGGVLEVDEIFAVLNYLGKDPTPGELHTMLTEMDTAGKGVVSLDGFMSGMLKAAKMSDSIDRTSLSLPEFVLAVMNCAQAALTRKEFYVASEMSDMATFYSGLDEVGKCFRRVLGMMESPYKAAFGVSMVRPKTPLPPHIDDLLRRDEKELRELLGRIFHKYCLMDSPLQGRSMSSDAFHAFIGDTRVFRQLGFGDLTRILDERIGPNGCLSELDFVHATEVALFENYVASLGKQGLHSYDVHRWTQATPETGRAPRSDAIHELLVRLTALFEIYKLQIRRSKPREAARTRGGGDKNGINLTGHQLGGDLPKPDTWKREKAAIFDMWTGAVIGGGVSAGEGNAGDGELRFKRRDSVVGAVGRKGQTIQDYRRVVKKMDDQGALSTNDGGLDSAAFSSLLSDKYISQMKARCESTKTVEGINADAAATEEQNVDDQSSVGRQSSHVPGNASCVGSTQSFVPRRPGRRRTRQSYSRRESDFVHRSKVACRANRIVRRKIQQQTEAAMQKLISSRKEHSAAPKAAAESAPCSGGGWTSPKASPPKAHKLPTQLKKESMPPPEHPATQLYWEGMKHKREKELEKALCCWEKSLKFCETLVNPRQKIQVLHQLWEACNRLKLTAQGLEYAKMQLDFVSDEGGNENCKRGRTKILVDVSRTLISLERFEEALPYIEAAMAIAEKNGTKNASIWACAQQAQVLRRLGRMDEAKPAFDKLLKLARELTSLESEFIALEGLASLQFAHRQWAPARELYGSLLARLKQMRREGAVVERFEERLMQACGKLGSVNHMLGSFEQSMKYCKRHLEIAKRLNDRRAEGQAHGNLGVAIIACKLGLDLLAGPKFSLYRPLHGGFDGSAAARTRRPAHGPPVHTGAVPAPFRSSVNASTYDDDRLSVLAEACQHFKSQLDISLLHDDPHNAILSHCFFGRAMRLMGHFDKAVLSQRKCLAACRELGDTNSAARAHGDLGLLAVDMGDLFAAREWFTQQAGSCGESGVVASAQSHLGTIALNQRRPTDAVQHHEGHRQLACELGDTESEAAAFVNLGHAHMLISETLGSGEEGDARNDDDGRLSASAAALGTATSYFEQFLSLCQKHGALGGSAAAHSLIASAASASGDAAKSLLHRRHCLKLQRSRGDVDGEGLTFSALAVAAIGQKRQPGDNTSSSFDFL